MESREYLNAPSCVLAVDPGLSGAICKLGKGIFEVVRDFRVLKDIAAGIQKLAGGVTHAVMENVHAMPGQGVCSMFSFGRAAGAADGALALALPHLYVEEVTPQRWQNFFRDMVGLRKGQAFDSREIASSIFPASAPFLGRKLDHNTADAVLMAIWKLHTLTT